MVNLKCIIAYKGTNFCGSQRQPNQRTVQGEIEKAIKQVTGEDVTLTIAGRTDSGVHANGQVINFKSETRLKPYAITKLLNQQLPVDVRIQHTEQVDDNFNARFCAKEKIYSYKFYCSNEVVPLFDDIALCIEYRIDIQKMQQACKSLIGKKDFKAFMSTGAKVKDTIREIKDLNIEQIGQNFYQVKITGNAFLYNMVRIIVGVLLKVGDGSLEIEDIDQIVQSKTRPRTKTAAAKGLTLESVIY